MKSTKITIKDLDCCWFSAAPLLKIKASTVLEHVLGEIYDHKNVQVAVGVYLTMIPVHHEYVNAEYVE